MAWGGKTHATQLVHVTTEQFFNTSITLGLGEHAHVQVKGGYPGGAIDYISFSCYSTIDSSSEQWDAKPFFQITMFSNQDVLSFVVQNFYKFRVSAQRIGSTDDLSADMWYRTAVQL